MADFGPCVDRIIAREGGYTNDPNDSGGETTWGITIAEARAAGYQGPMQFFPRETAVSIYRRRYWNPILGDNIADQQVAERICDAGVLCGVGRSVTWIQRVLNGLNLHGKKWMELVVDGDLGLGTLGALNKAVVLDPRHKTAILELHGSLEGQYVLSLCETREKDEDFLLGWTLNRLGLRPA